MPVTTDPELYFLDRVLDFNRNVVKIGNRPLSCLTIEETKWLRTALEEEARELENGRLASEQEALVDQVDACIDSIIFATGGLFRMGLTPAQVLRCLHVVMSANFQKRAGKKEGREGASDAVKPEGWVGPEDRIRSILFEGAEHVER